MGVARLDEDQMADLSGVRSSTAPVDRRAAARDLWPGGTLDMWQGRSAPLPDRVLWPRTDAQAARVLAWASAEGRAVVPFGAGSGVCGGARGRAGSVVLDTKHLDRIGPLDEERREVEVEAGVIGQHLEDWLQARGYTLGHSPSSIWCSTVGGWAAARGAGQFSSRYGVFEDMVLGLTAVCPQRTLRVGRHGEDDPGWMELLLGSEGTLGLITRMRLRVWPLPEARELRGYRFPDVVSAVRAMRRLMRGELWPAVLRLYDPVDTRIGGRTRAQRDSGAAAGRVGDWLRQLAERARLEQRAMALPLGLPVLVNRVLDGLASGCLLVVGWEGDPEVVQACASAGRAILSEEGEDLGEAPGTRWFHSRHHVSYKLIPIFEGGGFADTMEVGCRWDQVVPLYDAVRAALSRTAVVMAHMSHLYPEGGSIYFSFAGRGDREVYDATWQAALEAALAVGATVTHHHGVGELKAWAASAERGPAVQGWREARAELDPAGILNPGRLFVDTPHRPPPPPDARGEGSGLAISRARAGLEARQQAAAAVGGELAWPWERLPAPARWLRSHWQSGAVEVRAEVAGRGCLLGRGPRSAAGPDLRRWLCHHADGDVLISSAVAPAGGRWMGVGRPAQPWRVAWSLLRSDLRPAVLTVVEGELRVGFRGPAAVQLGALAAARVPGGLQPANYSPHPLPSGQLRPCALDDPGIVAVNLSGGLRRAGGEA